MADVTNTAAPTMANAGKPIARYEARQKVTGGKIYGDDLAVPGKPAHGWLVTSAIAKGTITAIDDSAAKAVPGVLMIMTHENRPPLQPMKTFSTGGIGLTSQEPLGGPEIAHDGQIVALIVAETFEAAREAGRKLDISYNEGRPATTFGSPGVVRKTTKEVVGRGGGPTLGDVEAALAGSTHVVEAEYSTPVQHHNTIEMFTTTAFWEGDRLTLHEPSQFVWGAKVGLAKQLGIDPDNVHYVSPFVGGAFGAKAAIGHRTPLVALAAKQLGRPVKLVPTRDQCFTIAGYRQETKSKVRLGCDAEGRLTGYSHELDEFTSLLDPYHNGGLENSAAMYAFKAVGGDMFLSRGDRNVPVFMRSPPEVPVIYALESAMNELAEKAGMDPVAFRKLNDTRVNPVNGAPYTSRSLNECFDEAAASFGWSRRTPAPRSMRDGDWLIGWGCSMATYPTSMTPATARVTLNANGGAKVEVAAHDVGTGAYTIIGQTVGERLGIDPRRIIVQCGDSDLPPGPVSGGSVTTASVTSAVAKACDQLLAKMSASGPMSDEDRRAAFDRIGSNALIEYAEWTPAGMDPKQAKTLYEGGVPFAGGAGEDRTMFAFGAEMVEVRINERTREIRVPRMTGAFAAGHIMNPRTAHSQYLGGMIWGMGSALLEATEMDRLRGRYVNDNIAEYLVATNADIPQVDIIMVPEQDDEINVLGVKGIGELANVGTAAAITDAVYHATGVRIRDLPVRIEQLLV
jgi:xanthine dehydrogenase YagR molybdenum-binding subunit|tara:strand:- start:3592 stop:5811 length:2220 start_codon:yes stop_codon:yes gene_type:complete